MRARKEKSAKAGGAVSFILMAGDDGAILLQLQKKKVVRRLFAQSPEKDHSRGFDELIAKFPRAPITLLIDMMDQSYVRQILPPVSRFSVAKIVRRRLNKDFAADDIKCYIILGREKKGRKDWSYLMASLANAPLVQKWVAFVVERSNMLRGIGLVPLESQNFLLAIQKKIHEGKGKDFKPHEWQILINHHKVGGFRQIVLRGGQLVFTRLAQMVGEPLPDVIAGNIEQELLNTLEYLKRLGLQDTTSMSVVIVASRDIKAVFDTKNVRAAECHFFTPYELAGMLGLEDAAQPEDHFGDIVMSSFIGRRRKLLLSLFTPYTRRIASYVGYLKAARSAAALAMLALLGWAGMCGMEVMEANENIETLTGQTARVRGDIEAEKKKLAELPGRTSFYSDVFKLTEIFYKRENDPLVFMEQLAAPLQDDGLVTSLRWTQADPLAASRDPNKRAITAEMDMALTSPREPRGVFVAKAEGLMARLKSAMPGFDMTHTDLPGTLSETKELKSTIDASGNISTMQANAPNETVKITFKSNNNAKPPATAP